MTRFTLVIAGILLGASLSVTAAEIYYRRLEKRFYMTPGCRWTPDLVSGFANPPNKACRYITDEFDSSYTFNSDGFTSPEFNSDPTSCNVMGLGDSHTRAVGVSTGQAWPEVAAAVLQPHIEHRLQFINMGVSGYSVGQEYSKMEQYLAKYKPRHVVVGFSLATDAYDIRTPADGGFIYGDKFPRPYFDVENGELVLKPTPTIKAISVAVKAHTSSVQRLKSFLDENSAFYRAAYRGVIGQYGVRLLKKAGVNPWPNADTVLAKNLSAVDERSWLIVEKLFGRFREVLAQRNIGFTVVVFPYLPQVYDAVWNRTFAADSDKYDRFAGNKRLKNICSQNGLDCLDLTDAFIQAARERRRWLHFREDAHPTAEGQALMGRLVAEHIRERLSQECRVN